MLTFLKYILKLLILRNSLNILKKFTNKLFKEIINMINILIITHGPLAKALADTSELIVGKNQSIDSIGLFHGESAEDFKHKVERKIDELSNENDLLIFTD